jgi:serine protease DegQ
MIIQTRKTPDARMTTMNRILNAISLSLMMTTAGVAAANANVPLPVIEHAVGPRTLAPLLREVMPAVVSILVRTHAVRETRSTAQDRRDGRRPSDIASDRISGRAGSGVVFDGGRGFIVTNNHVIDRAESIKVMLADGRTLPAALVGADPKTDIAVIKVEPDRLTAIMSTDSDKLQIGDFVLAIGNPHNIGQTVTSGIVSGLHRNSLGLNPREDFIQTDAAIYPGNSGGALINLQGELVGINSAFIGSSSTNPGMGFAIPTNMVRDVVDQILKSGAAPRSNTGITRK